MFSIFFCHHVDLVFEGKHIIFEFVMRREVQVGVVALAIETLYGRNTLFIIVFRTNMSTTSTRNFFVFGFEMYPKQCN